MHVVLLLVDLITNLKNSEFKSVLKKIWILFCFLQLTEL